MRFYAGILLISCCVLGTSSINVKLAIPRTVLEGSSPTFACEYSTGGIPPYSVKWYRGQYEFFRYVPKAEPQYAAFPVGGISVDLLRSNATHVTLKNVPKHISGRITCEVSADDTFKTVADSANLRIKGAHIIRQPYLNTSSNHWSHRSDLNIICIAEETYPPPLINFYVDNIKVNRSLVTNLGIGKSSLNSSALVPFADYRVDSTSPIWLNCDSYVPGFYHLSSSSIPIIPQHPGEIFSSAHKISESSASLLCVILWNSSNKYFL